jgi:hypothetical protein
MQSEKKLALVVLAAGMGSRYGGIKQIDGFGPGGETIMDYSLFDALRAGFTKVVFIVRTEILDTVKEKFLPRLQGRAEAEFVIQSIDRYVPPALLPPDRTKPWGTGHALLCARPVLNEPFAVINADDFYGYDAFRSLAAFFQESHPHHAMVGYTLKNVLSEFGSVSRGCGETDADGFLQTVTERTHIIKENGLIISKEKDGNRVLSPDVPTSMNFWGFQPSVFPPAAGLFDTFLNENHQNPKAEFYIPLIVNEMIQKKLGKVKVLNGGNTWFGVTYQEDKAHVIARLRRFAEDGTYPHPLWR